MVDRISFYTPRTDLTGVSFLFFSNTNALVDTQTGTLISGIWYSDVLTLDPGDYTVIVKNGDIVFGKEEIYWDGVKIVPPREEIAKSVRTELSTELAHLISLQNGLTSAQGTMLLELYDLMGLDPTKPLVVTKTSRTVGEIVQTIDTDSDSTVVVRE